MRLNVWPLPFFWSLPDVVPLKAPKRARLDPLQGTGAGEGGAAESGCELAWDSLPVLLVVHF